MTPTDLASLGPLLDSARIAAVGASTRGAKEFAALQLQLLREAVERHGYRSLLLEEDWTKGLELDRYLQTGEGDPAELLADARAFWRSGQALEALRWMRAHNERSPAERRLSVAGVDVASVRAAAYDLVTDYVRRRAPQQLDEIASLYADLRPSQDIAAHTEAYRALEDKLPLRGQARRALELVAQLGSDDEHAWALQSARAIDGYYDFHATGNVAEMEKRMAANALWWQRSRGDKAVYWGGMTHTANARSRELSPSTDLLMGDRSAGSYMRDELGDGYASIGLVFEHGEIRAFYDVSTYEVPPPPPDFFEARLAQAEHDTSVLQLRGATAPAELSGPAKTRLIGPRYDPADDAGYFMAGGSVSDWFDAVLFTRTVSPLELAA